jgi:iron complex outermembrane recepter protein
MGVQVYRAANATLVALCLALACPLAARQGAQDEPAQRSQQRDLTSQSLEDLMNVEVTSASKKEQTLSRVAAAIFVITKEDIRRSGATNIPDLLRMVPGLDVAQIDANTWAISARGLNEQFSNKLLVMVDGRSVYTPTFGGVYWDTVDVPLDDIERIEVVRGPGGTVWGANAVNGVINVITKKASETRGTMLEGGGGNVHQGFGTAQYGGRWGEKTEYRAYLRYQEESHTPGPDGKAAGDGWDMARGGFRLESKLSGSDKLEVEGDLYGGREGQGLISVTPGVAVHQNGDLSGGYVEGMWTHVHSERAESTLRASFDRYQHDVPFKDDRNTLDIEFKNQFSWGERQELVWETDYLFTNHSSNSDIVMYDPSDNSRQLFSGFVQDEIALVRNRLYFTVGTKVEHNAYNGFDVLPSARLAWEASEKQTLWAAVSRAVRIPTSGDVADDVETTATPGPGGIPIQSILRGNPAFKNEKLLAYEAGYRASLTDFVSIDFSAYFNSYHDLRTLEIGTPTLDPTPPFHFVLPLSFGNGIHGQTRGLEIAGNWRPTKRWSLKSGYAFEHTHMYLNAGSTDTVLFADAQGGSPRHSAQLQSHVDLWHGVTWDASAFFVGRLSSLGVPTYTRVDTGVSWRFAKDVTLSVVGQNLVRDHNMEYQNQSGLTQSTLTKRSVYAKLAWWF